MNSGCTGGNAWQPLGACTSGHIHSTPLDGGSLLDHMRHGKLPLQVEHGPPMSPGRASMYCTTSLPVQTGTGRQRLRYFQDIP